jgi:outer membrane protein assembly factor BamB
MLRSWKMLLLAVWIGVACFPVTPNRCPAADWPMWRYDSARTAVTPERLSPDLKLSWQAEFGRNHAAWMEDPRLQFDATYHPVVSGKTLLFGSATHDCVTALDTDSGAVRWRFFANGPIRVAPVIRDGRVHVGSDDGHFYCLSLKDGSEIWRLNAALDNRRILANERLSSVWPVRGGPVVIGDKLYFTAGVWPFEGALLYEVDLAKSADEPRFTTQLLEDVAPQGHLMAQGDLLFIPSGRANATCIDTRTNSRKGLKYSSRGLTDVHIAGGNDLLLHGAAVYDIALGKALKLDARRPVATPDCLYAVNGDTLVAYRLTGRAAKTGPNRRGQDEVKEISVSVGWRMLLTELPGDALPATAHLVAGDWLVISRGKTIFALDVQDKATQPTVVWQTETPQPIANVIAADGKLFALSHEGTLHCYAKGGKGVAAKAQPASESPADADAKIVKATVAIQAAATDKGGYCVVLGLEDGDLVKQLIRDSQMRVVAVDSNESVIRKLRQWAIAAGIDGVRLTTICARPIPASLPPYLAHVITTERPAAWQEIDAAAVSAIYEAVRPYGGKLILANSLSGAVAPHVPSLAKAKLTTQDGFLTVTREGALEGSADWTHEYGDAANSLVSLDDRVKAPLGLLWYGGPAGDGELYFNRHYWPPGPTIVEGRMFVQGPQRLAAIDIYTGRILWKNEIREGGGLGRRGNFFERHKPGYHFTAVRDAGYLVYPDVIERIDPATGETVDEIKPPQEGDQWGKARVWKDLLIAPVFRETDEFGLVPKAVVAVDRKTGNPTWRQEAAYAAPLLAVGNGRVYFFDAVLDGFYDAWRRRGLTPPAKTTKFLKAVDARTGKVAWDTAVDQTITWLAFSEDADTLVASNKEGMLAVDGKNGQTKWKSANVAPGFGGHPENVWDKVIVAGDQVIDQRGPGQAFDIDTGEPVMEIHPVTGEETPWKFTKTGHHCNYAIASPHLLTFRAADAGFFDRDKNGTARLSGFRSGCRNSLIPAGGVLNAPNYAHACVCSYNMFTSLALVHNPQADLWTYNALPSPTKPVHKFGVNFGAPGDRIADDGALWMEYPRTRDPSATIEVSASGAKLRYIRRHTREMEGDEPRWVAATAVEGVESITIKLPGGHANTKGTVRLYFAEPTEAPPERSFSISIQGDERLVDFKIATAAGGPQRLVVKSFEDVPLGDTLTISCKATVGEPLISGVELIAAQ